MVPELEEREACRFNGYTWNVWKGLDRDERIDGIAHYRLQNLIQLHQNDAYNESVERDARVRRGKQHG